MNSYTWIMIALSTVLLTFPAYGQSNVKTICALEDSEIRFSKGIRIAFEKGSEIQYPSNFNGRDLNITFSGAAFFEVPNDQTLTVGYTDIMISASNATFTIKKIGGIVEVSALRGMVTVMSADRSKVIASTKKVIYNSLSKNFIIKETGKPIIKRTLYFNNKTLSYGRS